MEITIKGTAKEIADLIKELQSQHLGSDITIDKVNDIYDRILTTVNKSREDLPINP